MGKRVGALILAAGFSNRFGSVKLLAKMENGLTVFEQTQQQLAAAIPDYRVITRRELSEALAPYCEHLEVFQEAERGMGATLAFGIGLASEWDSCLICLADMPLIPSAVYKHIADASAADKIIVPNYAGQSGNPVAFGSAFYRELSTLTGDAGGRPVLRQHADAVVTLPVDNEAILQDIDTPLDLARLQHQKV